MIRFSEVFFVKSKSNAAIINVCRPAVERWQTRYEKAQQDHARYKELFEHAKASNNAVLIGNAETDLKEAKTELDALGMFRADLVTFTRYYEFMSQVVDYDSSDLERLSLFARHLYPLLREKTPEQDPIDLSSVQLSHYRLSKIKQMNLGLVKGAAEGFLPGYAMGTGKAKSKDEEWLSQIITRLNDLFVTDGLTDQDLLNYAYTIRDKVGENAEVMTQIANNSPEQALLGHFPGAVDDAIMDSSAAHQNQMMQYLQNKSAQPGFRRVVFDLLKAKVKAVVG